MRFIAHSMLLNPAFWVVLFLGITVFREWKKRRWISLVGAGLIFLFFTGPPKQIIFYWERAFPSLEVDDSLQGLPILVLGAGGTPEEGIHPVHQLGKSATFRVLEGIRVWQRSPGSTLIMSSAGRDGYLSQAEVYVAAARELGVPATHLDIVPTPKTTHEEAVHFKEKFPQYSKVILVTSAMHMRRAKRLFEAQGIEVVPAPCNFFTLRHPDNSFRMPWPSSEGLVLWGMVFHEVVGMVLLGY
ncbi:YdcF family protein [Lunatibacter salilacus]|uniref:YdcF family protein n=1 Tax=Lunatibacter salilacus TaxID=2483804 RepID=UPI00131AB9D2|nr:YdcF family protein [Lunatibacter salilacus]